MNEIGGGAVRRDSKGFPFDPEKGPGFIHETIRAVEAMSIAPPDRAKIYEGNARRLLKLPGMMNASDRGSRLADYTVT